MQYYTAKDIEEMTGSKLNKSYEIVRNLNKKYKKRFPDCELIQGKVPKWFFHEVMGIKKEEVENEKDKTSVKEIC